jgi:hypothetical protein
VRAITVNDTKAAEENNSAEVLMRCRWPIILVGTGELENQAALIVKREI